MKCALAMTGVFVLVTGAVWVFLFITMWYASIGIEKAFKEAMDRWGRP
jgi:hypothetical protein